MTWLPEPAERWPEGPDREESPAREAGRPVFASNSKQPVPSRRSRGGGRLVAFGALLAVGLAGLAVSAVGIAHQLLPRQFSRAQQRQIAAWEVARRWRATPAGRIFPSSVGYELQPATLAVADTGLNLEAQRLAIGGQSVCATGLTGSAEHILTRLGCSALLRATYVDSSGSIVATVAVAVMPNVAAASAVAKDLDAGSASSAMVLRPLAVARTQAAGFRDPELSTALSAGPYVILSTAGFSNTRRGARINADRYLDGEMTSLVTGLTASARHALATLPPVPTCPGAPGC